MSELLVKAGLKLWLKGDGFRSSAWNDSSGAQAVGAFAPSGSPAIVYPTSGVPPYVTFGGAADFFTGPAPSSVMAAAHTTIFVAFYANSASATSASPWLDNGLWHGTVNAANPVMSVGTVSSVVKLLANVQNSTPTNYTLSLPISLGQWYVAWMGWSSGASFCLGIDPISFQSTAIVSSPANWGGALLVGKQYTGVAFFDGRVGELLAFNTFLAEGDRCTVFNYLSSRWEGRGDPLEMLRDVGSRRLWALGQPRMHILAKDVPISYPLPATLLDDTRESFFSHPRGIDPGGAGWGEGNDWRPRPGRIEQVTFDFDSLKAEVRAADLRPFRHSLIDSGTGLAAGVRREGQMAGSAGAIRAYSADVQTYYTNPADGLSIVTALPDEEKTTAYGLSLHPIENFMTRSSFVSGTTGLTSAGTGVNGSAIALDTATLLFDSAVTPNSLKFTAGNPHTTDLKETWPANAPSGISSSSTVYLAIVHAGNGSPAIQVQRSSDSKWLQDASGNNWGVSAVWVSIPAPGGLLPSAVSVIPLGAIGSNSYTVTVGLPSGGVAGRKHNVFHLALTADTVPPANGVFVVTDASQIGNIAVGDSLYQILLGSMGVGGPIDAQTIAFLWRPAFNGVAYPPSITPIVQISSTASGPFVSNPGWELALNAPSNTLVWRCNIGGAGTASVPFAGATIGQTYRVVVRRTTSHGDLGLTPYTLSIFLNGVKGTDAVESSHPADANIISFPGNGWAIRGLVTDPYAWSDAECQAWGT